MLNHNINYCRSKAAQFPYKFHVGEMSAWPSLNRDAIQYTGWTGIAASDLLPKDVEIHGTERELTPSCCKMWRNNCSVKAFIGCAEINKQISVQNASIAHNHICWKPSNMTSCVDCMPKWLDIDHWRTIPLSSIVWSLIKNIEFRYKNDNILKTMLLGWNHEMQEEKPMFIYNTCM
jgi:hypothetical protein